MVTGAVTVTVTVTVTGTVTVMVTVMIKVCFWTCLVEHAAPIPSPQTVVNVTVLIRIVCAATVVVPNDPLLTPRAHQQELAHSTIRTSLQYIRCQLGIH
jgi:hypothetical protein